MSVWAEALCRVNREATGRDVTFSDNDFIELRDFIHAACGIHFHNAKKYFLENRVARRMAATEVPTHSDYLHLLKNAAKGKDELLRLLDEITTNETCFFRNVPQLKAFENQLLPEILLRKEKSLFRKLRIWSAGSSSGEEAYTIAMILAEKRSSLLKNWSLEIVGTDINERVLHQAKEGCYTPYAVRNVPETFRKKYFTESSGQSLLSPEIKSMVNFSKLNLYDDVRMIFMKSFDFIICANVLIYFDLSAKSKIVQHFYNNLQPYGYLFIGQAESLYGVSDKFHPVHFPGSFAYRK